MGPGYRTVAARAEDEFVERKSRFIGCILPVEHEADALAFLEETRKRYWDASHNAYAYILREGNLRRCSDDGEPQGTAGVPVLDVLQKEGLTDVCVVVTRYFGGTLLGAGGLVRAYSHAAKLAVDAAGVLQLDPCTVLELECGYDLYGKVAYLLPQFGARVLESDFGAVVRLRIQLLSERLGAFHEQLDEQTSAQAVLRVLDECFGDMREGENA